MKVVIVQPDRTVELREINGWDDCKRILSVSSTDDPFIEMVTLYEGCVVYLDEDGIAKGLPENELATDLVLRLLARDGRSLQAGDYIKGTAIFLGLTATEDDYVETDIPQEIFEECFQRYIK